MGPGSPLGTRVCEAGLGNSQGALTSSLFQA